MPSNDIDETDLDDGSISERPLKRARMISKACDNCKLKKSRCDSSRPQCDACRRKGITCVYKERGQPGLRPGYGKAVESRLSMLEDNMAKISESLQDVLGHLRTQPQQQTQPTPALTDMSAIEPPRPEPLAGRPNGEPQIWQPPPNPLHHLQEMASFAESPLIERPAAPSMDLAGLDSNGNSIDPHLPANDILHELVRLFFEHVYPWLPLFHLPSFTNSMFSPDKQILLHGIVVLSYRFWSKTEPPLQIREASVKTSREQILLRTVDACTLTSTQALALLAADAIGQGPSPRTWNIMAMLVAAAQQLHLARSHSPADTKSSLVDNEDSDNEVDLSVIEAEEKRRLFWTIYSLDCLSSVSLGQPSAIDSKMIKLQYPASDEDWGQNVALEWFQRACPIRSSPVSNYPTSLWRYYIDVVTLVEQSNQLLIQPVNLSLPAHCQEWQSNFRRLDITLSTWFENLPREVREPPATFTPMWTMIHATFYLINIRMYTVAAFPHTSSPYLRPSSSARGCCRQAVRNVAYLAASLEPHQVSQLGPIFAFVAWVAARSLIILWTTGYETTYGSIPNDLEPLLRALRCSAVQWPSAQRHVDIIQLILDTKNNPGGPTGLDVFNDTRRTAYGLQNRLGILAGHRGMELFPNTDDFLDVPFMEVGDLTMSRMGMGSLGLGGELDGDWL